MSERSALSSYFVVSVAGLAMCVAIGGCEVTATTDRSLIPGNGGAPAVGGGGSNATGGTGGDGTAQGGGGTGATGGDGTGGGGPRCSVPEDCTDPMNACIARTCEGGTCGTAFVDYGTPIATQIPSDCKSIVCDGGGAQIAFADPLDVVDDMKECTDDVCTGVIPEHPKSAAGKACTENSGKVCDGAGQCVECNVAADCPGEACVAHLCVPANCTDLVLDGDETDVDCGGSCLPCADGKMCTTPADCASSVCAANVCAVPTCTDAVQNGAETDIDCGGPACSACADGKSCTVPADCTSNGCCASLCDACCNGVVDGAETDVDCGGGGCAACADGLSCAVDGDCTSQICAGGVCLPATCGDGLMNGSETDVDCGGSVCAPCTGGQTCLVPGDCALGFCADGFCCDGACTGGCQACSAAKKGSGANGVCGFVATGSDPDNECADQGAMSCSTDGSCNGAGVCRLYASGTVCAAQSCAAGVQQNADTCTGTGTCTENGTTDCSPYVCGATACKTSCVNSMDCLPTSGTFCNQATMQCIPKKADGQPCMGNNQCQSNLCKNGFCRPLHCNNASKDADETDIDCGGSCGPTCTTGQGCTVVGDCAPGNTQCIGAPSTCQP